MGTRSTVLQMPWSPRIDQNGRDLRSSETDDLRSGTRNRPRLRKRSVLPMRADDSVGR